MFSIKANPTIPAELTIKGQGREQVLKLVYKHHTREEYQALVQAIADEKTSPEDAVLALVQSWEADMPLKAESVKLLQQHQPGADWAIITGFAEAVSVARKGN